MKSTQTHSIDERGRMVEPDQGVPNVSEIKSAKDGLSVREAAIRIGVSYQTIHNWIRQGDLPVTRFGKRIWRIDPEDLDALRSPSNA